MHIKLILLWIDEIRRVKRHHAFVDGQRNGVVPSIQKFTRFGVIGFFVGVFLGPNAAPARDCNAIIYGLRLRRLPRQQGKVRAPRPTGLAIVRAMRAHRPKVRTCRAIHAGQALINFTAR